MKPRILDLFCGAGGAAMGYARAGFEVVGVDIAPQPSYPFEFIKDDALDVLQRVASPGCCEFDCIHASPPCQAYTTMSNRWRGKGGLADERQDLIGPTRKLLQATGLPYVIENVPGALASMRSPFELTGEMFGLGVHRPRLFESNVLLLAPWRPPRQANAAAIYGRNDQRWIWERKDGSRLTVASLEEASEAMGIDWMTWDELREAIPPYYTEYIGTQLIASLQRGAVA